jgi:hypothetical protein
MKKVYIVTHGEYSSYRIDAVFDKLELAEEYIRLHDAYYYNPVEEWELNPPYHDLKMAGVVTGSSCAVIQQMLLSRKVHMIGLVMS